jgi:hypothetical protein
MKGNEMKGSDIKRWRHQGGCCICHKQTDWSCPECKMYTGTHIWLCSNRECRKTHEADCSVSIAAN